MEFLQHNQKALETFNAIDCVKRVPVTATDFNEETVPA